MIKKLQSEIAFLKFQIGIIESAKNKNARHVYFKEKDYQEMKIELKKKEADLRYVIASYSLYKKQKINIIPKESGKTKKLKKKRVHNFVSKGEHDRCVNCNAKLKSEKQKKSGFCDFVCEQVFKNSDHSQ